METNPTRGQKMSKTSDTPESDAAKLDRERYDREHAAIAWGSRSQLPVPEYAPGAWDFARKLERERDEARREAEVERDKWCRADCGGHVFPWEPNPEITDR